jgi:hypothetical protein
MEIHAPRFFSIFTTNAIKHVLIKELVADGNVLATQIKLA